MDRVAIQSVQPRNWSPGFTPMPVGMRGAYRPPPLPVGPSDKIQETLGIAMASSPDAALGQIGERAFAASTVALLTLPALATAYVGFRLGTLDKGFPSILGYVVGTLASLGVLAGVLGIVGAVALPIGGSGTMMGPARAR